MKSGNATWSMNNPFVTTCSPGFSRRAPRPGRHCCARYGGPEAEQTVSAATQTCAASPSYTTAASGTARDCDSSLVNSGNWRTFSASARRLGCRFPRRTAAVRRRIDQRRDIGQPRLMSALDRQHVNFHGLSHLTSPRRFAHFARSHNARRIGDRENGVRRRIAVLPGPTTCRSTPHPRSRRERGHRMIVCSRSKAARRVDLPRILSRCGPS